MHQIKVRHGNKIYSYARDKYDNSLRRPDWFIEDEQMFLECLGLPKLEDDGTVVRERWNASRLEKLLWYKFCLTLRVNFDKINPDKLKKILDEMIEDEFAKEGFGNQAKYEMIKQIEEAFNEVNCL